MTTQSLKLIFKLGATLFFASMTVQAGETLHLKSSTVKLPAVSGQSLKVGILSAETTEFVIQFEKAINTNDQKALTEAQIEVLSYLPEDAYVVRTNGMNLNSFISTHAGVRAFSRFEAEWKIEPSLFSDLAFSKQREDFIVKAFKEEDAADIALELKTIPSLKVKNISGKIIWIQTPRDRLSLIAATNHVEWVEALPIMTTFLFEMSDEDVASVEPPKNLPGDFSDWTGFETGTKLMKTDFAWNQGFKGEGQIVGVADTGLDTGDAKTLVADFKNPFLKGIATGLASWTWADPQGHGTHVSGSIVSSGELSGGRMLGGAHGAKLLMQGMWNPAVNNMLMNPDMKKWMGVAYANGVRVHSDSWGAAKNLGAYDAFATLVDEVAFTYPELLLVFAAGNSGQDIDRDGVIDENSISSPGTAKNVLTVGASENTLATGGIQKPLYQLRDGDKKWGVEPIASDTLSNNEKGIAAFSSRGPTKDGRLKPEIVAPGTNIVSVRSTHWQAGKLWGAYNNDYVYAGGTSMATPLTASAALLVREMLMKRFAFAAPSASLVKASLIHTAQDLFPGQYGLGATQEFKTVRPNVHEGYGRVDLERMASLVTDSTSFNDEKEGVATSEEKVYSVAVSEGSSLRATLVYTDAPAAANAEKALVNDIDLVVIDSSGKEVTLNDHINNSELIELKGLAKGTYSVKVKGVNVPMGKNSKQPFALVVTTAAL